MRKVCFWLFSILILFPEAKLAFHTNTGDSWNNNLPGITMKVGKLWLGEYSFIWFPYSDTRSATNRSYFQCIFFHWILEKVLTVQENLRPKIPSCKLGKNLSRGLEWSITFTRILNPGNISVDNLEETRLHFISTLEIHLY